MPRTVIDYGDAEITKKQSMRTPASPEAELETDKLCEVTQRQDRSPWGKRDAKGESVNSTLGVRKSSKRTNLNKRNNLNILIPA